jgi:hypothetical protein
MVLFLKGCPQCLRHTVRMAKTPAPASSTSGVSTAEAKPRRSKIAQAGRGKVFIMPRLSGVEAAALMRAAGIVDSKGRLTKFYR